MPWRVCDAGVVFPEVVDKCHKWWNMWNTVESTWWKLQNNLSEDVSTEISKIQEELREKCKELYEKYSVGNMYEVKMDHEDEYNKIVSWYKEEMKHFEDKRKQICQNLKGIWLMIILDYRH